MRKGPGTEHSAADPTGLVYRHVFPGHSHLASHKFLVLLNSSFLPCNMNAI